MADRLELTPKREQLELLSTRPSEPGPLDGDYSIDSERPIADRYDTEAKQLSDVRVQIETFGAERQRTQAELQAELAKQIRADVESFKQELNLGNGWLDKLTSAMPKVRAFWKHKYTGWARLGLGLGLTAGLIASAVTGAWTLAFGAATARMLLGFVSTFMAGQELQASMARQVETGSAKNALADTSQGWLKRGWNAAKSFLTDGFDVATERSATMTAHQAKGSLREVLVEQAKQSKTTRDINQMETEVIDRLASEQARRLSDGRIHTFGETVRSRYERMLRGKVGDLSAAELEAIIMSRAVHIRGMEVIEQSHMKVAEQPQTDLLNLRQRVQAGTQAARNRTRNSLLAAGAVAGTIGLIGTDFSRLAETGKWIANAATDLWQRPTDTLARFYNWLPQATGDRIVAIEEGIKHTPGRIASAWTDFRYRLDHTSVFPSPVEAKEVPTSVPTIKPGTREIEVAKPDQAGAASVPSRGIEVARPDLKQYLDRAGFVDPIQRENFAKFMNGHGSEIMAKIQEYVDRKATLEELAKTMHDNGHELTPHLRDIVAGHPRMLAKDPVALYKLLSLDDQRLAKIPAGVMHDDINRRYTAWQQSAEFQAKIHPTAAGAAQPDAYVKVTRTPGQNPHFVVHNKPAHVTTGITHSYGGPTGATSRIAQDAASKLTRGQEPAGVAVVKKATKTAAKAVPATAPTTAAPTVSASMSRETQVLDQIQKGTVTQADARSLNNRLFQRESVRRAYGLGDLKGQALDERINDAAQLARGAVKPQVDDLGNGQKRVTYQLDGKTALGVRVGSERTLKLIVNQQGTIESADLIRTNEPQHPIKKAEFQLHIDSSQPKLPTDIGGQSGPSTPLAPTLEPTPTAPGTLRVEAGSPTPAESPVINTDAPTSRQTVELDAAPTQNGGTHNTINDIAPATPYESPYKNNRTDTYDLESTTTGPKAIPIK